MAADDAPELAGKRLSMADGGSGLRRAVKSINAFRKG